MRREPVDRLPVFMWFHPDTACQGLPLDWLWTGDDVARQTGMIPSPEAWRELIKPLLADIFAVGKQAGL